MGDDPDGIPVLDVPPEDLDGWVKGAEKFLLGGYGRPSQMVTISSL
ncbi:MAG: hypothetical protein NWF12_01340 [Candidatus Bathyarchaeota archaeon]|nr:hypothetical protein [Candidatus Bathyarchaeota archaeon]